MNTAIGMNDVGRFLGAHRFQWLLLLIGWMIAAPVFGISLFGYVFSLWPWSGQEALIGLDLAKVRIISVPYSWLFLLMTISPLITYTTTNDEKGLLSKFRPEGKISLSVRLLLVALAIPFLVMLVLILPVVFFLVYTLFALWSVDNLSLLHGYGYEAFKCVLWIVNLCLLHGVLCMLSSWMATNARREWQLELRQKGLNLACLVVFLVLYWQFSRRYGVSFADFYEIYFYNPKVTIAAIAMSLLFLTCSAVAVGFMSMSSMRASLRNVEQITLRTWSWKKPTTRRWANRLAFWGCVLIIASEVLSIISRT